MNPNTQVKEPPSLEKSMSNISWHLKVLVDEMRKLREAIESKGTPDAFKSNH